MKIILDKITERQKLSITKGLLDYQYIMNNWKKNDSDFQKVFFDFYLKARWSVLGPENRKAYFSTLTDAESKNDLFVILEALQESMQYQCKNPAYEFSIGSKLLHTREPSLPIYDSLVRQYLSEERDIHFWWNIPNNESGAPRGTSTLNKIKHDWTILCNWYKEFLNCPEGKEWIRWFITNYPDYANISNIKMIDFIIVATTG